ncbi:MAG: DUF2167 domain-containing protein [Myxococcota bacterium]
MHNPLSPRREALGALVALLLLLPAAPALAEEPPAEPSDDEKLAALKKSVEARLKWQQGDVTIKNGLATLQLGKDLRYLDPESARYVLEDLWGNPPGELTLGMIFPADVGPVDDDNWGVVVTYEEDGHVKDDDAASINYDELLKEMKADTAKSSEARKSEGYPTVELVGWAEPPHYDAQTRKLHWAKELVFGGDSAHTLNYDIRALGRRGVLVMQAVAGMDALATVKARMPDVVKAVEFNKGHTYAEFDASVDEVAAYGIGALVAGKVASKVGLLAGLAAVAIKAKKLLFVAVLAIGALLKKVLSKKNEA